MSSRFGPAFSPLSEPLEYRVRCTKRGRSPPQRAEKTGPAWHRDDACRDSAQATDSHSHVQAVE